MSITIDSLLGLLGGLDGAKVYERSAAAAEGTACAIVRTGLDKRLAVAGDRAATFAASRRAASSSARSRWRTRRRCRRSSRSPGPTATPGTPSPWAWATGSAWPRPAMCAPSRGQDVYPVLAQQSIRELTLTNRTFADVIAAAAFGVFQEGYRDGYGADGDHLKTKEEIKYALERGCTMITLDCSEHIDIHAAALSDAQVEAAYAALRRTCARTTRRNTSAARCPSWAS